MYTQSNLKNDEHSFDLKYEKFRIDLDITEVAVLIIIIVIKVTRLSGLAA